MIRRSARLIMKVTADLVTPYMTPAGQFYTGHITTPFAAEAPTIALAMVADEPYTLSQIFKATPLSSQDPDSQLLDEAVVDTVRIEVEAEPPQPTGPQEGAAPDEATQLRRDIPNYIEDDEWTDAELAEIAEKMEAAEAATPREATPTAEVMEGEVPNPDGKGEIVLKKYAEDVLHVPLAGLRSVETRPDETGILVRLLYDPPISEKLLLNLN